MFLYTDSVGCCKMLLICSTVQSNKIHMRTIGSNYFHQRNDVDWDTECGDGDGDVTSFSCYFLSPV